MFFICESSLFASSTLTISFSAHWTVSSAIKNQSMISTWTSLTARWQLEEIRIEIFFYLCYIYHWKHYCTFISKPWSLISKLSHPVDQPVVAQYTQYKLYLTTPIAWLGTCGRYVSSLHKYRVIHLRRLTEQASNGSQTSVATACATD